MRPWRESECLLVPKASRKGEMLRVEKSDRGGLLQVCRAEESMREHYIKVNGIQHYVLDEGAGKPVVLLHGFPDSSSVWRHQVPALGS
jgi:hypothetical protein